LGSPKFLFSLALNSQRNSIHNLLIHPPSHRILSHSNLHRS
jgi:hypothetical protein